MSARARIAGFAALLAAVFAAATLAGAAIDPSVDEPEEHEDAMQAMDEHEPQVDGTAAATLPGLAFADGGYRLVSERTSIDGGPRSEFAFRIVNADDEPVRDFDLEHERRMHLIVIRRDFQNFQHLHPQQLGDGSWVAEADLSEPGVYRAFADFSTGGDPLTLATDLFVRGNFDPRPLPAPKTSASAGDGYEVSLASAPPSAGATTAVRFTVSRDGRPLDSIDPYLGADGHLVALREHDQAFLHTHPEGEPGGPGPISFQVKYPSPGRYRLFLQFKHRGEVRTAAFTQEVEHGDH